MDNRDALAGNFLKIGDLDLQRLTKEELISQIVELRKDQFSNKNTEANLRTIIDNNQCAIWSINRKYEFLDFNNRFAEDSKLNFGTIPKKGGFAPYGITDLAIRKKWMDRYEEAFRSGNPSKYLDQYDFQHGSDNYFEIEFFPVKNQGEVSSLTVFSKNVSIQERNRKELETRDKLMTGINEATQSLLIIEDFKTSMVSLLNIIGNSTGCDRSYIFQHDIKEGFAVCGLKHHWGKTPSTPEINNKAFQQIIYVNDGNNAWLNTLKNRQVFTATVDQCDAKTTLQLQALGVKSILLTPIMIENNLWGFIGFDNCSKVRKWMGFEGKMLLTLADSLGASILRVKVNLKLKEQNDELNKVNKELDRFVYSASHDLRTPLASILGLINIAKHESKVEDIMNCLQHQEKSVKRLDSLIKDIIHYSRNTRLEVDNTKCDLKLLVTEVFEQFEYEDNSEKIEKIIKIDQSEDLFTDSGRLKIILNNIISNAIRYHDITKPNPYLIVDIKVATGVAKFEISDNGSGIAEEFLDKIFDMFYRAREDRAGSGLGLYIVKETTEKLNGSVRVSSQQGDGTTFTIQIPNLTNT